MCSPLQQGGSDSGRYPICSATLQNWYYLFPKQPYTLKLINAVKALQDPDGGGFYAGIYGESEEMNTILTGNTNGLILEILYFKALGNTPILEIAATAEK